MHHDGLFFYPADFTFVCPTELGDLSDFYEDFKEAGCEIYSVSEDTHFVHKAWADAKVLPEVEEACMSVQFGHIMSGGYSAGYYSYKWAEVLDADAFSVFKETGIFNQDTARSFRENILSKGGTEHPMTLYKRFRGQEPTIEALLKRNSIK